MVSIGEYFGKKVAALVTNMNSPLGNAIGNTLEVWESCEVLKGNGPDDLKEISVCLAANMLYLAGTGSMEECEKFVLNSIKSGAAFNKFKEMILAQGGDISIFENNEYIDKSSVKFQIFSPKSGYITSMDAGKLGKAAMILGAGREKKEDSIDYSAGIILNKKPGDKICSGEILATFYSSDLNKCRQAEEIFKDAVVFGNAKPIIASLVHSKVTAYGAQDFTD